MIGIIGGSGFCDPEFFEVTEKRKMNTPFGAPSDEIAVGRLAGIDIAFLNRHGPKHSIPPHKINSRANIWALRELGCKRIIATGAVGSLREEYEPGSIVFLDQFIDMTRHRQLTFYDGPDVYHISIPEPFCPQLRDLFSATAKQLGIKHHNRGTLVCIEGPRFSTKAESNFFRNHADLVGMTLVPEVSLAREAELCFLSIAMITDYDVWRDRAVSFEEIAKTMAQNIENLKLLIKSAIGKVPQERACECKDTLKSAKA